MLVQKMTQCGGERTGLLIVEKVLVRRLFCTPENNLARRVIPVFLVVEHVVIAIASETPCINAPHCSASRPKALVRTMVKGRMMGGPTIKFCSVQPLTRWPTPTK